MLKSYLQGDETRDSKTVETRRCKPRKGGVSCGTFKCTYIVKPIFSCVYTGISSGNKLAIGGTLTKVTKHLKGDFIKRAWKKQQMSFLKKGAKIHLKNECVRIDCLSCPHS